MNYLDAFRQTVARTPEAVAVRTPDGRETTYAELDRRTDRVASALDERVPGDRVGTLLDGGPAAVDALLAAQKRGRAVVPLNVRESPETLAFMLENADARALVFDDANAETAAAILERVAVDAALAVGDADGVGATDAGTDVVDAADVGADVDGVNVESYEAAVENAVADADTGLERDADTGLERDADTGLERDADAGLDRDADEFAVFYTSGSTGRPKGVLTDGERLRHATTQTVMEMGVAPADVALVVTPLFHLVTAESWVLPHFQAGATVVLQPHFEPEAAVAAIEDHGVTQVLAVPPQLDALAEAARSGAGDVSTLERVRTGGGPLHESTVEAVHEHLAPAVYNTYGLTEAVSNVTHAYPEWQRAAPGTVGRASFNWAVRVVEAVGPGETPDPAATVGRGGGGEVLVRGPTTADGYLDRPEAEADLFVDAPDGGRRWLRTGDVAEVDDEGYLHVVDRVDNMLVTGGENVYPQEVESTLEAHPDVEAAAVVGVPDDRWGTAVAAVVVGDAAADDLDDFCVDHDALADFKRPRYYEFADELPRSPLGKLQRDEIRERHYG